MTSFSPTTCPSCAGWGVTGEPGGLITCPTCHGDAVWLSNEAGQKYTLTLPSLLTPNSHHERTVRTTIRYALTLLALVLTLGCFGIILSEAVDLLSIVWAGGLAHVGFGVGGLATMYCLSLFEGRRTSGLTLHDLPENPEKPVDLFAYANPRVMELLEDAARNATILHDNTITDSVFLKTILEQPRIQAMIARLEHVPDDILTASAAYTARGTADTIKTLSVSPQVRERLFTAFQRAHTLHFPYIDVEDILLAYAEDEAWQSQLFSKFDMSPKAILAITKWYAEDTERQRRWAFWREKGRVKPKGFMNRAWTALPTPFLDHFSRDLTSLAAQGAVPGTTARVAEVTRALEVLGNPTEHNLLLVGEPGVGKNAVLMSIAFRMVEENVPEQLRDHRLVEVDIANLLSSPNPEQNVQTMLNEVAQAGNVILAIPDVHSLVSTSAGPLDAAAVLASALKQGALQVISTATYADYHRYVEQNAQLSSLLTVVEIKPPSIEQTVAILEEEAAGIEHRENVYLTYPAVEEAAELAERYLTDQVLPQSAITLLGEAASVAHAAGKRWVQATDIQGVIEKRTGVPVKAAGVEEGQRLLNMETELHKRIIGQEVAVKAVADALRRARAGLHSNDRPISTFLFVGPTGVGKTEMAKAVANIYFGREESFIRLDMSEYQDGTAVYRLIGAPPGTSESHTEGGALTQPIREHPFSLILLDEIEKAHPDVLNLFLQLLDDGRLTENTGRTVQYRNAIVVATSNAASPEIMKLIKEGVQPEQLPKQILNLLQQHFRPEFLNRFDAVIPFQPLTQSEAQSVTSLLLTPVIASAAEQGITLNFSQDAVELLTTLGYDPQFGGRPLRRVIQDKVEALLARLILGGSITKGDSLQI
ncbi:MAG: AAA family ATPase, partial [Candidatus Paceibacterota bacterium]